MNQARVLICDDDQLFHLAVKHSLKGKCECRSAYNGDEALALLRREPFDLLLLDVQIRTPNEGLELIPKLVDANPDLSIVMSSGLTDFQTVREAMRAGATDYVPKDASPDELIHSVQRALGRRELERRREQQNCEAVRHQKQHALIGESAAMRALRRQIEKIRTSRANVVITGETGTGKEVVARQLRGSLADGSLSPFVAIDSATIQSTMAESILFGHEKGAFTGADRAVRGVFEEADGGSVYFDEIGNMPLDIQAKLLRVLQEREVTRLGSARPMHLEFRVICATNRNLEEMIAAGQFKDDLYQRINVLPIEIPPLRERHEDIPSLVEHFVRKKGGARPLSFTAEAIDALQAYPWPGNIRELANVVAYVATMAEDEEICLSDLPPKFRDRPRASASPAERPDSSFYKRVADFERSILEREYRESEGNVSRLALRLGMDRSHLYTKLKEYGLRTAKGARE